MASVSANEKPDGAADVPDRGLGFESSERGDLRDPVGAVFIFDILNDLGPAADAKIDVDIGHRLALGIEETFEQQDMADRIEIGDAQRVSHQTSGRRAASRVRQEYRCAWRS